MEQFVWETAEELDQKLAKRVVISENDALFLRKNYLP